MLGFSLLAFSPSIVTPAKAGGPATITSYIQPSQAPAWGYRSYWKQPWLSYLDTAPATTLLEAVGINFNVSRQQAPATARLLGASGFTRARLEVGWGAISYDNPHELSANERTTFVEKLTALRDNGIRPLILLNGNHGKPCPTKPVTLSLLEPAAAGATQVTLDPATIEEGEIVPKRTGITAFGVAAAHLITSVDASGIAQLSKPLTAELPAGPLNAVTLRYEPFSPATLPDGSENPRFRATMNGWLAYARAVTQVAKATLGSEEFDVEIWNELSFGSNFLDINRYYEPDSEAKPSNRLIIEETVRALRDTASGAPNVDIGNGFASQSPHGLGVSGTAIDKHPYFNVRYFPASKDLQLTRPLNALGEPDGWRDETGGWHDSFSPTFVSYFPEYSLSAIQTETLVYDLAPYESKVGGSLHGRYVIGPGATEPSPVWITEVNLVPTYAQKVEAQMTAADIRHLESKNVLRYLAAFINKGVAALHFYGANAGDLSLIDKQFFDALKSQDGAYPGDDAGGETMAAVRRLTEAMDGAAPIENPRELSLDSLTDYAGNAQFAGDGTVAHGPLYNRDVFAFLPFQVNDRRFVIPIYVMTRNVAEVYKPNASTTDPTRFDMQPERYRLIIGGVNGIGARVWALDPISGDATPARVVAERPDQLAVVMQVTDSPRLLTVEETTAMNPRPGSDQIESTHSGDDPQPLSLGSGRDGSGTSRQSDGFDLDLSVRSRRTLLRQRHLIARTHCDESCIVAFHGTVAIGAKRLAMQISARRRRVARSGRDATARLAISRFVSRAVRRALGRGAAVRVEVSAAAVSEDGGEADSRRIILLSSPRPSS